MRVALLTIADAANSDVEGKLNILGAGVRVLRLPIEGAVVSLAIVCQVDADANEVGVYPTRVTITSPTGELVVETDIPGEVPEPRITDVPTGFGFVMGLLRPFGTPGVYVLTVSVEGLEPITYPFKVLAPEPPTA